MTEVGAEVDDQTEDRDTSEDPQPYPYVREPNQKLRAFIFKYMANAEIDGVILVKNCERIFDWIKSGKVPRETKKGDHLAVVEDK